MLTFRMEESSRNREKWMRVIGDHQISGKTAGRLVLVDLIRGLAIIGVVVYHLAWDLSFLGFVGLDVGRDPAWSMFARVLAGTFVGLVGINLVLGHHQGIRWQPFWKRIGILTIAAAAITATTVLIFPQAFIYFGILHAIALFSIVALPFLRAPTWLLLAAAAAVFILPDLVQSPAFNKRWLAWIGLGTSVPPSNDFEPLFPWFGLVLLGMGVGRALLCPAIAAKLSWQPQGGMARVLVTAGRWSLVIYLVHQPILLGALYPVAWLWPSRVANQDARFLQACRASCTRTGEREVVCQSACDCSARELRRAGLWQIAESPQLTPDQQGQINHVARACFGAVPRSDRDSSSETK
ncbi:DUF1624 domain-containing protein [Microvirga mediterraneensis]|uniref:DUF1624 domain-containing protein n=1 Tax=Microvirga mediterraneensis TaxID=2754695 RepID=A0A838BVH3_9HYPH|nr:heparan-alpha-glucosaminide N-acetyltransferase [Microvirga mediterraneensis]MBA1158885.1 DUF1624 domain-containing protein [Microvirga mediterraneensis]